LTPAVYWREREILLNLDRDELEKGLETAKSGSANLDVGLGNMSLNDGNGPGDPRQSGSSQLVGAPRPDSRLGLDIGPPTSSVDAWDAEPSSKVITIYIVGIPKAQAFPATIYTHPTHPLHLVVALPSPKIDSWAYKDALSKLVKAIRQNHDMSTKILLRPGTDQHLDQIISTDEKNAESLTRRLEVLSSPEDPVSSRKTIIPIALLLLCAFSLDGQAADDDDEELTKSSISNILLSLVGLWPDSNPPRAALKRVNEVLLSRER
jgi:tRNA A64-2'-O-ribosylphosphate transferase